MTWIIPRYLSSVTRYKQTYWLISGAILGYVCFVLMLGTTALVIGVGGAITLAMIAAWFWTLNQALTKSTQNLLEREIFLAKLRKLELQIDKSSQKAWRQAYEWAEATQQFATQIAQREPILIPELLEALHTVLALAQQVVSALETVNKVKSSTYRPVANQKLEASFSRLQQTHDQLQHLQDQVLLSSINNSNFDVNLPQSLQLVIEANKIAIQ